ncbi:MAG: alpha/beta hydrolase [Sphingopyxis sp.]|nr:alpha/beta hydrolase [Sphingopyxis sp.]
MSGDVLVLPAGSRGAGARLVITHWPVEHPRGVVLLAHGLFEHAGRYAHVAARMNAAGLAVVALDHMGHGRSDGTPGYVAAFSVYLDGMDALLAHVRAEYPHRPLLLLGHSMGGLIAVHHLLRHPHIYAAAAVSGPAILPAAPPSRFTIWISRILSRLLPRLGVVALDANGVSRDPAVVAAYRADPLVYDGKIGARLAEAMFDAMGQAAKAAPRLTVPLLVQHGDADMLAAPAGGQYLHDHAGSADKQLILYPGLYHEIFNEPEQVSVLDDLVAWFDAHLPAKA